MVCIIAFFAFGVELNAKKNAENKCTSMYKKTLYNYK